MNLVANKIHFTEVKEKIKQQIKLTNKKNEQTFVGENFEKIIETNKDANDNPK